jgi:hypothetical protein
MDVADGEITARLDRIEEQLRLLCAQMGIPYEDGGRAIPGEVVALARRDERIKAALRLTETTGMDFAEAQRVVNRL